MGSMFCALLLTHVLISWHRVTHVTWTLSHQNQPPCHDRHILTKPWGRRLWTAPLGSKIQVHMAIWKYCAKQALGCALCLYWGTFVTELFISSLYSGIQIISSLYNATITNSSNSVGSAPESIHMGTFSEIQGLCWKQLANIQNWRQDCKQYSSKHHKFSMESVF